MLLLEWALSVRMSSWRDSVLAAEAKKAGRASEDTRLTLDALLRRSIQHITNSDLSESQWIQASLPVRDSGLATDCRINRNW